VKTNLCLITSIAFLTSCNSGPSSEFDYCKYATKNSDYSYFFKGDVIDKCTVIEPKSVPSEEGGYKSIGHTATLELTIKDSKGEIRTNKRWIQLMDPGGEIAVIQNKTK
jgi:hypothetical protein